MRSEYTTRQRERILQHLKNHAEGHVTAEELLERLSQNGHAPGKATVLPHVGAPGTSKRHTPI